MGVVCLVLGDQLFDGLPGLPPEAKVVMQEDLGLATCFRHHQQKLVLFFSAMRHFAADLGPRVAYRSIDSPGPGLLDRPELNAAAEIHTYRVADRSFRALLRDRFGNRLNEHENPSFLTPDAAWRSYAQGRRRLMGDFYARQRRRLGIMVDPSGEPLGGRWSFDEENRKKIPAGLVAPVIRWSPPDAITREVIDVVRTRFAEHPGRAEHFAWPVTRAEALRFLHEFLAERFDLFGPYEDAISKHESTLWHSLLSPLINMGLLTPAEVVAAALAQDVPIASKEGFIRQIIGWREFIKRIDEEYGENGRDQENFFGHERRLGPSWWTATTGLPPLDGAIERCQKLGWCHHIERLMVLGSSMLMAGVNPRESYRWFMEMFVDSAEWVMAPNVFGMSQFSDGGTFATKPYLSGSAYLLKMSDYPRGSWCEVWDGLYWRFIAQNRDFFFKNPRLAQAARGLDRLEPLRRDRIFAAAEDWVDRVTLAPVE